MSDKQKWPRAQALSLATKIKALLVPVCEVVEIAGSLRREKPFVGDIELVFVPKIVSEPDGLFDKKPVNLAHRLIDYWLESGIVEKRLAVTGKISSWSNLNRHAVHKGSGIPVDFFCEPDILDFPRSLVVRTGSREFNVELMATAPKVGIEPHAYGVALKKLSDGERVIATDERNFIELCGMKYREPKDR
jgi:DNA polymerase/3'-5' exonuclease PolX